MPSTTWSPSRADALDTDTTSRLLDRLGYRFVDPELLELALTHRSWCAEHAGFDSNERLEFLGDSVLGMVVTDHLYRRFVDMPEGQLAKVRAAVVDAGSLAGAATRLDLGLSLRLGKGEDSSGGREKSSILADAMEAVIGAVYLDGGLLPASELVLDLLLERIEMAAELPGNEDFKTKLQEFAAHSFDELPSYDVRGEGPDHEKRFFAVVSVGSDVLGRGEGRSKKQAEQAAARSAWEQRNGAERGRGNHHA